MIIRLLTFDSIDLIWMKKIQTRINPRLSRATTKKLKNINKLIFDEAKYTIVLKKVSCFWTALMIMPTVEIIDTNEYALKLIIFVLILY